jgi:translation elongation factor EF-4
VSGKTGLAEDLLEAIVKRIPPPQGDDQAPLKALIFDSTYDTYRGVVVYVRIKEGTLKTGQKITMMGGSPNFEVLELGVFRLKMTPVRELYAGESGYIVRHQRRDRRSHRRYRYQPGQPRVGSVGGLPRTETDGFAAFTRLMPTSSPNCATL